MLETLNRIVKVLVAPNINFHVPQWFSPHEESAGNGKSALSGINHPKVFIAYSWDDNDHKQWVADFAANLRQHGIEIMLDQWYAVPGDRLADFVEKDIRSNDYVLIVCTPEYRSKCESRYGWGRYEGDVITEEVYNNQENQAKFIPVLAKGTKEDSVPEWINGKFYIDLSTSEHYEYGYPRLLATLLNTNNSPSPEDTRSSGIPVSQVPETFSSVTVGHQPESFYNRNEDQAEYIRIPGGSYIYSVTGKEEHVPPLYVAKYPVTNKMYRAFIDYLRDNRDGHGSRVSALSIRKELKVIAKRNLWWPKFGDHLYEGNNDLVTLFRSKFEDDRKFNGDDQPVVGITWYAARAYCLWLSMLENETLLYRLPTEIEWEWAAGGRRTKGVQKVSIWPWPEEEGDLSYRLANYGSRIGATTPVGSHPDGATQEGLYDMAGNVWEWMDSWYDAERKYRSLRGGSWGSGSVTLHCNFRSVVSPLERVINLVGFRVFRSDYFPSS